jgi:hypothetical protein
MKLFLNKYSATHRRMEEDIATGFILHEETWRERAEDG